MRRQALRRMANRDLNAGFAAWTEMWEARCYALGKLRQVANKLKAPEVTNAFNLWWEDLDMTKRSAAFTAQQRDRARLEFEISESKNEVGELKMVVLARDDELKFLHQKHDHAVKTLAARDATIADLSPLCDRQAAQIDELLRQLNDAQAAKALAEQAHEEVRVQMIDQNVSNRGLLEKLLAEQRVTSRRQLSTCLQTGSLSKNQRGYERTSQALRGPRGAVLGDSASYQCSVSRQFNLQDLNDQGGNQSTRINV